MNWHLRQLVISGMLSLMIGAAAKAAVFSQMTVFGDSLSDTGNIDNATFGQIPGSGYFDGRFSNGPLYVEYLAQELGIPTPMPSSQGGRNYAYGGAWAGDQTDFFSDLVVEDLEEQVPNYLSERTPMADELFVLYAGSNDLIDDSGNVSWAIASFSTEINLLAEAGARHFFVPNLPRLDLVPRNRGTSDEAPLLAALTSFNLQLGTVLDDLEAAYTEVSVYGLDVTAVFSNLFENPAAFGFTNVVDEARGLSGIDPDNYLFWDDLHPTTAGHELLAAFALTAILEPHSLPGDYNGNGEVDAADYTIWADNFGSMVSLAADGNDNGVVDAADYTVWADNFGDTVSLKTGAVAIPEPSSLVLIILGCLVFAKRP